MFKGIKSRMKFFIMEMETGGAQWSRHISHQNRLPRQVELRRLRHLMNFLMKDMENMAVWKPQEAFGLQSRHRSHLSRARTFSHDLEQDIGTNFAKVRAEDDANTCVLSV